MQNILRTTDVSMSRNSIALRDIKLWGYHGCLPEERKVGTEYSIDFVMKFDTSESEISDDISDTIDYSQVHTLIVRVFSEPVNLLEHLARKIMDAVVNDFPAIKEASVTIRKYNPPMKQFNGNVEITLYYSQN
ncbi:MAG: dihydroneopterin aldolase [Bacteroidales bacterium]|nr:dihydroneopterin aldolase [Bacteroidales bacterium]